MSAESESKLTQVMTLGSSLSWFAGVKDTKYLSLEAKFRIYPNEEAFRGFSIGIAGGVTHVSEDKSSTKNSATAPTVAVIADYNWLLGKTKRFLVGTGVGAKRIFGNENDFSDVNFAYPTIRFQIGVVF
ncbi:MAG: hypothetical protein ABIT38_21875 [Gemmatimonadaceae bacterium]